MPLHLRVDVNNFARIIKCDPEADNFTRVVTVKTTNSEYKRQIVKLYFLLVDINENAIREGMRARQVYIKM